MVANYMTWLKFMLIVAPMCSNGQDCTNCSADNGDSVDLLQKTLSRSSNTRNMDTEKVTTNSTVSTRAPCTGLSAEDFAGEFLSVTQRSTYHGIAMYTYDITIGGSILQKTSDAGNFNIGYHQSYNGMTEYFTNGDSCGSFRRSATITYTFGPTLELLSAVEPSMCAYQYAIQLPESDCEAKTTTPTTTVPPTPAPTAAPVPAPTVAPTPAPTKGCIDTQAREHLPPKCDDKRQGARWHFCYEMPTKMGLEPSEENCNRFWTRQPVKKGAGRLVCLYDAARHVCWQGADWDMCDDSVPEAPTEAELCPDGIKSTEVGKGGKGGK